MCVAIYKPAKKNISKKVLKACSEQHPDGCGMAYIHDGQITMFKCMKFEDFYPAYIEAFKQHQDSPFMIHFRKRTRGPINLDNCHPFMIDEQRVFMHNGTITPIHVPVASEKSDTRLFNEYVLQNLPEGWEENEAIQELVEEYIGHSKLVVMDTTGKVTIFNEDAHDAKWREGVWFSNTRHDWRLKPKSNLPAVSGQRVPNHTGTDHTWTHNGIKRCYIGGQMHARCPLTGAWRPFDTISYKFTDKDECYYDVKKEADESKVYRECGLCGLYEDLAKTSVWLIERQRTRLCDECVKEMRDLRVEMFRCIGEADRKVVAQ